MSVSKDIKLFTEEAGTTKYQVWLMSSGAREIAKEMKRALCKTKAEIEQEAKQKFDQLYSDVEEIQPAHTPAKIEQQIHSLHDLTEVLQKVISIICSLTFTKGRRSRKQKS